MEYRVYNVDVSEMCVFFDDLTNQNIETERGFMVLVEIVCQHITKYT